MQLRGRLQLRPARARYPDHFDARLAWHVTDGSLYAAVAGARSMSADQLTGMARNLP